MRACVVRQNQVGVGWAVLGLRSAGVLIRCHTAQTAVSRQLSQDQASVVVVSSALQHLRRPIRIARAAMTHRQQDPVRTVMDVTVCEEERVKDIVDLGILVAPNVNEQRGNAFFLEQLDQGGDKQALFWKHWGIVAELTQVAK